MRAGGCLEESGLLPALPKHLPSTSPTSFVAISVLGLTNGDTGSKRRATMERMLTLVVDSELHAFDTAIIHLQRGVGRAVLFTI